MKTIKGLFFDLDGTLVDTLEANTLAYQHALNGVGRTLTDEQIAGVFGMRADTFLPKFFPDITERELSEIKRLKIEAYPEYVHLARPNKQLIDFVRTLKPNHVTALVTMAQKANALAVLQASKLEDLFDHIVTGSDVTRAKPDPESYQKALELTGLDANEVLAFEDSDSGIEAAKAAGISVLTISIADVKE